MNINYFSKLPKYVSNLIFQFVDFPDIQNIPVVSKSWLAIFKEKTFPWLCKGLDAPDNINTFKKYCLFLIENYDHPAKSIPPQASKIYNVIAKYLYDSFLGGKSLPVYSSDLSIQFNPIYISLSYNKAIIEFPLGIEYFSKSLALLFLSYLDLKKLPKSFIKLNNLTLIDISGNKFKEIPEVLFKLNKKYKLRDIIIKRNLLPSLPEKIHSLKKISLYNDPPEVILDNEDFNKQQWQEIGKKFQLEKEKFKDSIVEVQVCYNNRNILLLSFVNNFF